MSVVYVEEGGEHHLQKAIEYRSVLVQVNFLERSCRGRELYRGYYPIAVHECTYSQPPRTRTSGHWPWPRTHVVAYTRVYTHMHAGTGFTHVLRGRRFWSAHAARLHVLLAVCGQMKWFLGIGEWLASSTSTYARSSARYDTTAQLFPPWWVDCACRRSLVDEFSCRGKLTEIIWDPRPTVHCSRSKRTIQHWGQSYGRVVSGDGVPVYRISGL